MNEHSDLYSYAFTSYEICIRKNKKLKKANVNNDEMIKWYEQYGYKIKDIRK